MKVKTPPLRRNVGKRRTIKNIKGKEINWVVKDEIARIQSTNPHKAIHLQKLHRDDKGITEFRFGYYIIGVQPGAKGRWVWGQYALLIPKRDLRALIKEARRRKWL
ncbi:MAG: hypothetical protein ACREI9_02535 [Nitrospiraceae bacterium]